MGEFQCYQFRSFERPLTEKERAAIDSLSSRAQVSSHAATFVYNYGDFHGNPEAVVAEYFDAMIYFANWGTRQLIFRLPIDEVDKAVLQRFCLKSEWSDDYIKLTKKQGVYLLDIYYHNEDGGGWMEETDFDVGKIGKLRDDILAGDYRSLYLIWAQFSCPEEDREEVVTEEPVYDAIPPVPANFNKLTGALTEFTYFFEIDIDLITAIQSVSATQESSAPDYEKLLQQLPPAECIEWLKRLLSGEPSRLDVLLKKRLNSLLPTPNVLTGQVLSPAQLWAKCSEQENKREAIAAAEAQAAYIEKMEKLASEEAQMWETVSFDLQRKSGKSYGLVTATLTELRNLAIYQNKLDIFQAKMTELRKEYGRSSSLLSRWDEAGL